jgi:drug/metabolite transporter (DMT)-like permease
MAGLAIAACLLNFADYSDYILSGIPSETVVPARHNILQTSIVAALSYGFVSVYTKKFAAAAHPQAVAGASQGMAGLLLLPLIPLMPAPGPITASVTAIMIIFALTCSGVAFLLYFRLIADIGPTKALTVTFLMPAFTMFWAALFLDEAVTLDMILGCALILGGTGLVVLRR